MPEDLFRPSLAGAHHYAYVVENIEATVERLAEQLGAGPFFLVENVPLENITSRGEPAEFVHHSAFGYCGGGPIELIEIVRLVPERIEGRFSGARPGVHHVAWAVPPASVEDLGANSRTAGYRSTSAPGSAKSTSPSTTRPPRWATTSRSTSTARDWATFSRWCARAPRVGTGRNRFVPPPPDSGSSTPFRCSPNMETWVPQRRLVGSLASYWLGWFTVAGFFLVLGEVGALHVLASDATGRGWTYFVGACLLPHG